MRILAIGRRNQGVSVSVCRHGSQTIQAECQQPIPLRRCLWSAASVYVGGTHFLPANKALFICVNLCHLWSNLFSAESHA
jgi:hypothetical protein